MYRSAIMHDHVLQTSRAGRMTPSNATIYWDCTFLSLYPNRNTGIERVVRELGRALSQETSRNGSKYLFKPCISDQSGHVYALTKVPGLGETIELASTKTVSFVANDILITDASWDRLPLARLARHWRQGLILGAIQHDVIPLTHSDTTTQQMVETFSNWMLECAQFADFYACNSNSTKSELTKALKWLAPWRSIDDDQAFTFTMGAKVIGTGSSPETYAERSTPNFLMVGTVEPRKHYELVLDAFEDLWKSNHRVHLTIVGAPGWNTKVLQRRIEDLEEQGQPIDWHKDLSDDDLSSLYAEATALIMASQQEGFGLPIVEALSHGTPVIASDIDVFHEAAEPYALWFSPGNHSSLASLIRSILDGSQRLPTVPSSYHTPTWQDAARSFLKGLENTAHVRKDLRELYDARVSGLTVESESTRRESSPLHTPSPDATPKESKILELARKVYLRSKTHRYGGYPIRLANALLKSSYTRHEVFRLAQQMDHLLKIHDSLEADLIRLGQQVDKVSSELSFFETRVSSLLSLEREHTQSRLSAIEEVMYSNMIQRASDQEHLDEAF